MAFDAEAELRRPRARRWRFAFACAGTLISLTLFAVVGAAAFVWRLSVGPMQINEVAHLAERVLSETLGAGHQARVAKAELEWATATYGLIIRLEGIEIGDGKGGYDVNVPSAAIELRSLPLLWGAIKPRALALESPRISIDLAKLDPGMMSHMATAVPPSPSPQVKAPLAGDPPAGANAIPRPAQTAAMRILEQFAGAIGDAMDAARDEGVTSVTANLGVLDVARPGQNGQVDRVTIPEIKIDGVIDPGGDADLNFSAKGEIGYWDMRLRQSHSLSENSRHLVFEAHNVTLKDLVGTLPPDMAITTPFYPKLEADLDRTHSLTGLKLDMRLGAGQFRFGKYPEDELLIDEGQIALAWDPVAKIFRLDHAGAWAGDTVVSVKGQIVPPAVDATGDAAKIWTFDLGLDQGVLAPRDAGGDPMTVEVLRISGNADLNTLHLNLPQMETRFGGSVLTGTGYIDFAREKPQVITTFALSPTDWQVIRHAWPSFIAGGARNWFLKQVFGGTVTDAEIKLDLPLMTDPKLLPLSAAAFSGKIQGGAIHTFGDLPDAIGLDGHFSSKDKRFEAVAERGSGATKYPRKPDVMDMRLIIADSFQRTPKGHFEFHIVGENGAIGEIANSEPLAILDDANIRLDGISGSADVRGTVDMILEEQPKPADIDFHVEAVLDRFASPYPILNRKFQEGNVKVVGDPKGTSIVGKAKIDGVVTDVNMYEPRTKSKLTERRDFRMTLDEATRQRMGMDLGKLLAGPIQVAITQAPGGNEKSRHIDADLTASKLAISLFGWTKGTGVPAKAVLDLVDDDKGLHLDNFSVEAEGLQIKGRVDLDKDRKPVAADFNKFNLHKGDDVKIKATRQSDQSLAITFEAGNFDARGLLQSLKHSNDAAGETDKSKNPDMVIKARMARLIGFNDIVLTDAVFEGTLRGGAVQKLTLTGRMPGGRSMEIQIKPDGSRRQMSVVSDDAGAVMAFLDFYDRMRGGDLKMTAALSGPGIADGTLRIVGFRLQAQGKSIQAATVGPDGTRTVAIREANLASDGSFDRFAANYSLRKGVITVTEIIAKGPATGATGSGQIDLNNQKMQLAGTYIPLYGLNNLVSRIPLLGEIAGAGRNEGLVGVTFKVVGLIDDPVLQVNPISAIAPGILRKIFEYHVEPGKQAELPTSTPEAN